MPSPAVSSDRPLLETSTRDQDQETPPPKRTYIHTSSLCGGRETSIEKTEERPPRRSVWIPLALRRWVFITVAFLFAALVVLQVLFQHSNENQRLGTNSSTDHYLWKFGPTAGKRAAGDIR